jgi:PPK2 family polyphosphate:nucleotide phosphotransferase
MIKSPYLVEPGKKFRLDKCSTDDRGDFAGKEEAQKATEKDIQKLIELQYLLYAGSQRAVLIVFQAMDAGGKDGAISHVFSGVNPQGCQVTSFKVPSELEKSHDFLWRIHQAVPRRGMIGIFNRSHYESVLVERVHNLVPEKIWSKRYQSINDFEKMLHQEGTIILKFFLHISKDEQKNRLEARLEDKTKNWKFSAADVNERRNWDQYQQAFGDALENCSTPHAPWYAVPSDRKWFRNWVISDAIVRTLEELDLKLPTAPPGLDKIKVE